MKAHESGEALLTHQALELEVALHDAFVREHLGSVDSQRGIYLLDEALPSSDAELHHGRLEKTVLDLGPAGCKTDVPQARGLSDLDGGQMLGTHVGHF